MGLLALLEPLLPLRFLFKAIEQMIVGFPFTKSGPNNNSVLPQTLKIPTLLRSRGQCPGKGVCAGPETLAQQAERRW